jgi:hypothetical protein
VVLAVVPVLVLGAPSLFARLTEREPSPVRSA